MSRLIENTPDLPELSLLTDAHSRVGFGRERRGLVRDLQAIHNGSAASWQLWLHRAVAPIAVKLNAASVGPGVAFDAKIVRHSRKSGEVAVDFGDLDRFEQRAGWAAIQLYRQKAGLQLESLHLADSRRTTALRYNGAFHSDKSFMRMVNTGQTNLLMTLSEDAPWAMPPQQSYVFVQSRDGRTLPDMLHVVQNTYARLYPEYDTDTAVAHIVGTLSIEAFEEAWYGSLAQYDPVSATQSLLSSGVFIAARHC